MIRLWPKQQKRLSGENIDLGAILAMDPVIIKPAEEDQKGGRL
jgi:hypothetical protein